MIKRRFEGCDNSNWKVINLNETYTINNTSIDSAAANVANSVNKYFNR